MDAEQLLPGLAIGAAGVGVLGYFDTRRKYIMEKGARAQELITLKTDVTMAHDKIRNLEVASQATQVSSAEMKKDIEYIRIGTDKMEVTLAELRELIMKIPRGQC